MLHPVPDFGSNSAFDLLHFLCQMWDPLVIDYATHHLRRPVERWVFAQMLHEIFGQSKGRLSSPFEITDLACCMGLSAYWSHATPSVKLCFQWGTRRIWMWRDGGVGPLLETLLWLKSPLSSRAYDSGVGGELIIDRLVWVHSKGDEVPHWFSR